MSIDWSRVERVLIVRLRSIGDTVLATPSATALRRFLPNAQIDFLLEDWVAPLLEGHDVINNVIPVSPGSRGRLAAAREVFAAKYDVVFNLHGGTTATFFTAASRASHRVGLAVYQYSFLYNHLLSSPADFWGSREIHSAEQQLALLGFVGVPVEDRPRTSLTVAPEALERVRARLPSAVTGGSFALIHPAAAFATKQWPAANFAGAAEFLAARGMRSVAVAARGETTVLQQLQSLTDTEITVFDDLTLPEITALASEASLFIGNDSGIAHIAAAVGTPSVVIFGSSNRTHWRPWTDSPNEIVYQEFACQPCAGYECKMFGEPRCILGVSVESVVGAADRMLSATRRP